MKRFLPLCLLAASLAGCAMPQAPVAATPVPAPAAAPPPAMPAEAPIAASGSWEVATARCAAILTASDDDRAAVGMFYYGYLAARANTRVIEVAAIEPQLRQVFATCAGNPNMTILDAFRTPHRRR